MAGRRLHRSGLRGFQAVWGAVRSFGTPSRPSRLTPERRTVNVGAEDGRQQAAAPPYWRGVKLRIRRQAARVGGQRSYPNLNRTVEQRRDAAARRFRDVRAPHLTLLTRAEVSRAERSGGALEPELPVRHAPRTAPLIAPAARAAVTDSPTSRHAATASPPHSAPFCTRVRARTRGAVSGRGRAPMRVRARMHVMARAWVQVVAGAAATTRACRCSLRHNLCRPGRGRAAHRLGRARRWRFGECGVSWVGILVTRTVIGIWLRRRVNLRSGRKISSFMIRSYVCVLS